MKTLIKACLLSLVLLAHGAFAADLKTAKEQRAGRRTEQRLPRPGKERRSGRYEGTSG